MRVQLKVQILRIYGVGGQWRLARQIGISESTLSRIVVGRRDPSPEERKAIANALGITAREVFREERNGQA